jgi:transcriptional regulator with XRE-family HTH domain
MATPDPLRDAIREYLHRTGESARELSLKAGLNEKAIGQILNGRSQSPRGQTLARLANVLGVPISELLTLPPGAVQQGAAGIEPRRRPRAANPEQVEQAATVRVPELDVRPQGGGGAEMPTLDGNGNHAVVAQWSMPADYLRAFVSAPEHVRIVRVAGDSMEPEYPAGERVAVDTSHTVPSPPGVYVLWDGFGLVLKRLEILMGSDPPRVRLSSINPAYPPYERLLSEIMVNGRVIGKWTWR